MRIALIVANTRTITAMTGNTAMDMVILLAIVGLVTQTGAIPGTVLMVDMHLTTKARLG
jgi:hypothetical protein